MPESVYALMSAPGATVDLYDALSVRFEGGAIGTVSGAGTVPAGRHSQYQVDLRIFGTEGMLMLDCERARLELRRHDGRAGAAGPAGRRRALQCEGPPAQLRRPGAGQDDGRTGRPARRRCARCCCSTRRIGRRRQGKRREFEFRYHDVPRAKYCWRVMLT